MPPPATFLYRLRIQRGVAGAGVEVADGDGKGIAGVLLRFIREGQHLHHHLAHLPPVGTRIVLLD